MGHIRLGTLLKTQKRQQVVDLIAGEANIARIAAAPMPLNVDSSEHLPMRGLRSILAIHANAAGRAAVQLRATIAGTWAEYFERADPSRNRRGHERN
jgi:hypothetical protein